MHIPHPKLHTVRYYGEYSSVARARRRATLDLVAGGTETPIDDGCESGDQVLCLREGFRVVRDRPAL